MLCCMNKLSLLDNGCNYLETTEHHLTCLPTLLLRRTGLFLSNWRSFPQEMVYLKRRDHIKSRCILVLQYCISPRILSRSYLTVILCRSEQNDPCLCSIYLLYIFSHWGIIAEQGISWANCLESVSQILVCLKRASSENGPLLGVEDTQHQPR